MDPAPEKTFPLSEVEKHNTEEDLWLVIDGDVYDVSKFVKYHPGGKSWLIKNAGKDVSEAFKAYHGADVLRKYKKRFCIGTVEGYSPKVRMIPPGSFGELVPYGDPIWYQRFNSPYFKESHKAWREKVRAFVDKEIIATMSTWVKEKRPPADLCLKMGNAGFLAAMMGPPFPAKYVTPEVRAQIPKDFDYFHEMILYDEIARCGSSVAVAALTNGPAIGLTAICRFGSEEMKNRVMPDVLMGRKFIALAVSEPNAGSDVAGLITVGVKNAAGTHYIVNGNKKWITNGLYADYLVTAVVTDPSRGGQRGMSFLLIDAKTEGCSTRKVNVRDSDISGTAYIDFDNCAVPVENRIGDENQGFKLVMHNFNHERFYVSVVCTRMARVCLEESIKYASRRDTFGKKLHQHQSIRMKVAAMARSVEQLQAWLELLTYQMCTMDHEEANLKVGDVMALLKCQASKTYEYCARETTHIFGGNALCFTGVGSKVENAVSQVKGYAIPAGAEDIMDDFAARVAFKMAGMMAKM
eukprot:TRINITY_DN12731_c0_g1_i1.p1 TRINITY_DN12731_c0_g1~~TRINITY_DN12731_c0_g1_i1.p1  ORF type:complete len:523 (-),score=99.77 TRINITY_DN12731_c0_g1_i1:19-1587(-)